MAWIQLDADGNGRVVLDHESVPVRASSLQQGHLAALRIVLERSRQLGVPVAARAVTPHRTTDMVVDGAGTLSPRAQTIRPLPTGAARPRRERSPRVLLVLLVAVGTLLTVVSGLVGSAGF